MLAKKQTTDTWVAIPASAQKFSMVAHFSVYLSFDI